MVNGGYVFYRIFVVQSNCRIVLDIVSFGYLKDMYMYIEKIIINVYYGIFVYRFIRQLKIFFDNNIQCLKMKIYINRKKYNVRYV